MAVIRSTAQPMWQPERWGFSGKAERNLRDLSHTSILVFAAAAVATGVLASVALSSEYGVGTFLSFVVVAILFPLLCGCLVKERWRAKKLEDRIRVRQPNLEPADYLFPCGDSTPAGLLIVSPDLRICFADLAYLHGTLQSSVEVLGWKIQDVTPAEGIEARARSLLESSDPAASCCFDTLIAADLPDERLVHITMTRIAPWQGEQRILVVIEAVLPDSSLRSAQPVEGYVC